MSEALTLARFNIGQDSIYDIGATETRPGVLTELKTAFAYEGDDLNGLLKEVAPHKTLQDNIAYGVEVLSKPEVQAKLGYEEPVSAYQVAYDLMTRAGLQEATARPYKDAAASTEDMDSTNSHDVLLITDGVVNWMNRTGDIAIRAAEKHNFSRAILASSNRKIGGAESPDVEEGTSVNAYLGSVLLPKLVAANVADMYELIGTNQPRGDVVMSKVAQHLDAASDVAWENTRVYLPSVAGNWVQKGSQALQALVKYDPEFDGHNYYRQLYVETDTLPLGITGEEPKTTHQNPVSAIGNFLRAVALA